LYQFFDVSLLVVIGKANLHRVLGTDRWLAIAEFDSIGCDDSFSVGDVSLETRIHISQFLKANIKEIINNIAN
jgi:hypothetical protein